MEAHNRYGSKCLPSWALAARQPVGAVPAHASAHRHCPLACLRHPTVPPSHARHQQPHVGGSTGMWPLYLLAHTAGQSAHRPGHWLAPPLPPLPQGRRLPQAHHQSTGVEELSHSREFWSGDQQLGQRQAIHTRGTGTATSATTASSTSAATFILRGCWCSCWAASTARCTASSRGGRRGAGDGGSPGRKLLHSQGQQRRIQHCRQASRCWMYRSAGWRRCDNDAGGLTVVALLEACVKA